VARIVLDNVSRVYPGGFIALNNASIDIQDGEFVVLVGPSGCGKSTTLRMIAGLDEISSGNIYIEGMRVNDLEPKDRDIAMVFQNYALYPHLTAYENMAFGLKLRKYPKAEIQARVTEAARILGISQDQLQRKPKALSGGQRQRVAVGRAIVRHPKAFLFDEPLSNLDAKMRVEMRTEISKLHNKLKSTMIYVTHDQVEAMTMGDRIVVMKDGLFQQVADPLELYDNPCNKFVAGFIGSPAMNFFHGFIHRREGLIWFTESAKEGENGFSVRISGVTADKLAGYLQRPVLFGCRPENIHASSNPPGSLANTVTVNVEVVEPMGAETHFYLSTGMHSFVVRVQTRQRLTPGDKIDVAFDMQKCHFFDAATEKVIV
jgi:multiple sugar transport system ATP-binding protein